MPNTERYERRLPTVTSLIPLLLIAAIAHSATFGSALAQGGSQGGQATAQGERGSRRDSLRAAGAQRIAVTAEHLRTAFKDAGARVILEGARIARLQMDSALHSYDARAYQRISVDLSFSALGRQRLAYRSEGATRVRWQRDRGALVEVEGARAVAPVAEGPRGRGDTTVRAPRDAATDIQLPWFPGSEPLWIGSDVAQAEVDASSIVHPLATGSEAYYQYARGHTAEYRLPNGQIIQLVELLVTPRLPRWNLVVGSFWFDSANHRLVKAVYRLAVPLDIWSISIDDGEDRAAMALARFLVNPVRGTVGSITVEYALLEGRFWLPRLRTAEGLAQVSFVRVPFELQQKYEYSGVNGVVDVPEIPLTAAMAREDSIVLRDSLDALPDSSARERARLITQRLAEQLADSGLARQGAGRDSAGRAVRVTVGEARRRNPCDTAAAVTAYSRSENRTVRIMTTATCNDSLLINSARFPHSIYTSAEELLGATEREELQGMLGLGAQSRFAPQKPVLKYGIGEGMLRYNRVEGLSPAIGVGQLLGAGLSLSALVRAGTADHEVNGEAGLTLSSGTRTLQLNGYRRLVATNDWGNPLGFGASFQAMVFGRDEGFYYRGTGAELLISGAENPTVEWRLFAERQRNAEVEAEFSIANSLGDRVFPPNIVAERGDVFGAGFRMQHSLGVNPDGLRLYTQLKAENAIGDFDFARGLVDATFSTGLFGVAAVGVTLGIGSSMGHVPAQRHFLLGGTHSVRGQRAGTSSGDAFWMTRFELGTGQTAARRVLFADFGWAGSREDWGRQSRALSGVGLGWSFLDGLIRMDIARGIHPGKAWRFTSYVDARF